MNHLSTPERHALAERLEVMRQRVLEELRRSAPIDELGESSLPQEVHSNADQAEAQRVDDVRFAEIEIDRRRLHDIEQAQLRMTQGRYGICADCGDDIPPERLLSQPIAVRCAACQEEAEKRRR